MSFFAKKVRTLPPYLFSVLNEKKKQLEARGIDVIDLGIGAPDLPTPPFIVERMAEEIKKGINHRYPPYAGCQEFREAVALFYKKHYNVALNPETEVLALIGSKEGIAHLVSALVNPGEGVLIPNPSYPVYRSAVHLAGGESIPFLLEEKTGYTPQLDQMTPSQLQKSKLMFLNYPGNPTAATIECETFAEVISFAKKNQVYIAHDAAYQLVTFDHYKAPSILQIEGAKDVAVELGSLSKSFNMTGWRMGYIVGNKEIIRALSIVKSNVDTGQFLPIQKAAATALTSDLSTVERNSHIYEQRIELMMQALRSMGMEVQKPKGTFFLWVRVPPTFTSMEFTTKVLEEAGIVVTPGNAFGSAGEGYFRVSVSVHTSRLHEAIERMSRLSLSCFD